MSGTGSTTTVADGVFQLRTLIANLFFVSVAEGRWLLVDAGLAGTGARVLETARRLFGERPPEAILLTHAHFDHRGALPALLAAWDVPVYAHPLEFPYLTGQRAYPAPDPSVGGGLMARLSFLYPSAPIDLGPRLLALPVEGSVPHTEEWRWIHTPGHSPGHVAFFRAADAVLIAGDAIVTTRQESAAAVLAQRAEVRPPPAYYTLDWAAAQHSARTLAELRPEVLATGHGPVMRGPEMQRQLARLTARFRDFMPRTGWYLTHPAHPETSLQAEGDDHTVARRNRWRSIALAMAGTGLVAAGAAALRRRTVRTRGSYTVSRYR